MNARPLHAVVALAVATLLSGCRQRFAAIPPRVTLQELEVYETFLRHQKQRSPEDVIGIYPATIPIPPTEAEQNLYPPNDPIGRERFEGERKNLMHDGVSADAISKLEGLGDAAYPLIADFDPKLATFDDRTSYSCGRANAGTTYAHVGFSRVVFSHDGQTAFLHVSSGKCQPIAEKNGTAPVCECGGGFAEYLLGKKQEDDWNFKRVGPWSILD